MIMWKDGIKKYSLVSHKGTIITGIIQCILFFFRYHQVPGLKVKFLVSDDGP